MSFFQLVYGVLFLLAAVPALGYARYLHDDAENRLGALAVFALVALLGAGLLQMHR